MRKLSYLLCCAVSAWAQVPEIAGNGIVNAAANIPAALIDPAISPHAVVARGALLTIHGANLGSRLAGISLELSGPAGLVNLPLVSFGASASDPSVTARVPTNAPLGQASLILSVRGLRAQPYPVTVASAGFGIYAVNGKGWGPGRIEHVSSPSAGTSGRTLNTVANSASFPQTLALSGTGLGDAKNPEVWVGGRPAVVISARATPDADEILFELPSDAPEGCFVPVQVRNAGVLPSNVVTMAIHRGGGACLVPDYFPFTQWTNSSAGFITISRTIQRVHGAQPVLDEALARFVRLPELLQLHPYFLLPPPGVCTTQIEPWRGEPVPDLFAGLLVGHFGGKALRAGAELTLDDGKTVRKLPPFGETSGLYDRRLSDWLGHADQLLRLASPAVLRVAGTGGADVGPFHFSVPGVRPFEIAGPLGPVRRGEPLRLDWSGIDDAHIVIVVANFTDEATQSQGSCYCVTPRGAAGFTIPAQALAYFPPAGRLNSKSATVSLRVIAWPAAPLFFQARGLDHAFAAAVFSQSNMDAASAMLPTK